MNTILIEVFLPAAGISYDIRVPGSMNSLLAAHLTADALANLSDGNYRSSGSSIFAWRDSGKILETGKSLEEAGVKNGSKLLLI